MQLNKFQSRFKDLMLDHPDALKALAPEFAGQFIEGSVPLARRLAVYRNNIVGSLTDVMQAGFPLIVALVGEDFFKVMARSFILKNPPTEGSITFYGRGFDAFIAGFEPAASLPYLPDMARLELAMNDAYHAVDDTAFGPADLAALPPEDLAGTVLRLRACVHLLQSAYPLADITTLCRDPDQAGAVDIAAGGVTLMVTRRDFQAEIVALGEDEFDCLTRFSAGETLGEAVEQVLSRFPAFDFQAFLQKHLTLESFLKEKP